MVSVRFFIISLALVACVAAAPKKSKEEIAAENALPAPTDHVDFSGEKPVVVAHVKDAEGNEHEFRAPYFDAEEEPLPMEAKLFADDVITQVMKPGKEIIESALIKGRNNFLLTPQLGAIGVKFFFMAMGFHKKSKQLKKKYNRANDDEFQQDAMALLPSLVSKAKEELKAAGKEDSKKYSDKKARKATGVRILLIFDGVKQLVLNSPVGTHLDFKNVTIDGGLMTDEAVEYIKFMNKTGLGWIIDLIDGQCNKISAEQKKLSESNDSGDSAVDAGDESSTEEAPAAE